MAKLIIIGLLAIFRTLDPMALELSDKASAATAMVKLPPGAAYKLRKVELSSLERFCFKAYEHSDDGKPADHTIAMGCYPPGSWVVTFDHDESAIDGAPGRSYVFVATRADAAVSYQVFLRALVELVPQYAAPPDPVPVAPPLAPPAAPPPTAAAPPPPVANQPAAKPAKKK